MLKLLTPNRQLKTLAIALVVAGLISLAWASPGPAIGQQEELETIVEKLQAQYDRITDLSADFGQVSTIKAVGRTQKSQGRAFFKKPGMMRWDYQGKEGQKIVSDGRTLWLYFPEDNQVQVARFSRVWGGRTPTAFLAGLGNLKKDFKISFAEPQKRDTQGNYLLSLVPNEPLEQVSRLTLVVDSQSFLVKGSSFADRLGNATEITLKNIRTNEGLKSELFTFTIPPDVEVIRVTPPD